MNDKKPLLLPKSDFIFKSIFGNPDNIGLLADLLKSILTLPPEEYGEITILNPVTPGQFPADKTGILDIKIKTTSGKIIDVEIQIAPDPGMRERIAFYLSRLITGQIGRGDRYGGIKQVIGIYILDYKMLPGKEYHNRYRLTNPATGRELSDILEVNTIELPKLPETGEGKKWEWLAFLSGNRDEELETAARRNREVGKAMEIVKELSEDERTRMIADAIWRKEWDRQMGLKYAHKEGEAKGRVEGRAEGRTEEQIEIARRMKARGRPIEEIAGDTGLPETQIKEL